jgi:anti-sigma regulatory factor (Ser/Thr protein kinase)
MSGEHAHLTLMLVNQPKEIERACSAVEEFSSVQNLSGAARRTLALMLNDVLANVIRHGYEDTDEHIIRVRLWLEADLLSVQVADDGVPFNPLLEPELGRPAGGVGIHGIRTMIDDIEYRRTNGQNLLTLRARVDRAEPDTVA